MTNGCPLETATFFFHGFFGLLMSLVYFGGEVFFNSDPMFCKSSYSNAASIHEHMHKGEKATKPC